MTNADTNGTATTPVRATRTWQRPEIRRIKAGEAELGANPIRPEGLAQGS